MEVKCCSTMGKAHNVCLCVCVRSDSYAALSLQVMEISQCILVIKNLIDKPLRNTNGRAIGPHTVVHSATTLKAIIVECSIVVNYGQFLPETKAIK